MIAFLLCAGWLITVLVFLIYLREREISHDKERNLLILRIQHPEIVTVDSPRVPDEAYFTSEPDDIDLVGTIDTGDPSA